MNSNIVLIGLNYEYIKPIAVALCDVLDMFYLDVKNLITYNLPNKQTVISTVSASYYEEQINKLALSTITYENSVINFPYELFIKKEINPKLQDMLSIYVELDKNNLQKQDREKSVENKLTVQLLAYEELNKLLKNKCKICVTGQNVEQCVNNIIEKLKNNFSEC